MVFKYVRENEASINFVAAGAAHGGHWQLVNDCIQKDRCVDLKQAAMGAANCSCLTDAVSVDKMLSVIVDVAKREQLAKQIDLNQSHQQFDFTSIAYRINAREAAMDENGFNHRQADLWSSFKFRSQFINVIRAIKHKKIHPDAALATLALIAGPAVKHEDVRAIYQKVSHVSVSRQIQVKRSMMTKLHLFFKPVLNSRPVVALTSVMTKRK